MTETISPFAYNIPFFSIFLAMLAAIAAPLLPRTSRAAERLTMAVTAVVGVLSAYLLANVARTGDSFTFMMGHFPAPWGNELRAGPLEALLALFFCASMFLSLLGNVGSTEEDIPAERRYLFCVMVNLILSSLLALIYTNDIFTAYVFIEINTIAACAVVAVKDCGETIRAALRYLVMSLVGSGLILISICLLYDLTGHLLMQHMRTSIAEMTAAGRHTLPLTVSLILMTTGLAIKSALYPFGSWLPDAHGNATNASSAILSGLVLKGHIFLIVKVFFRVFGTDTVRFLHMDSALLFFGMAGMAMGSLHALRQTNLKRMIAWSSIAQVGYIFLGIGLNTAVGIAAGCLHILVHAVIKPMLFTAAGGLIAVSGHKKEIQALRGAFYRNRWAGVGLIAGACSMIGIPLFAGFASKLNLAMASFESPAVLQGLAVLALSTLLNALYYIPAVIVILTSQGDAAPSPSAAGEPAPPFFGGAMAAFLALNFLLGLFYDPIMRIIGQGLAVLG